MNLWDIMDAITTSEIDNSVSDIDSDISSDTLHKYPCSSCNTIVTVDPLLIYTYDELQNHINMQTRNYWHAKYAYSKEVEPGYWLTFCRKVCEVRYNRQDDWESSPNKK